MSQTLKNITWARPEDVIRMRYLGSVVGDMTKHSRIREKAYLAAAEHINSLKDTASSRTILYGAFESGLESQGRSRRYVMTRVIKLNRLAVGDTTLHFL